jgi:hypothetical protein
VSGASDSADVSGASDSADVSGASDSADVSGASDSADVSDKKIVVQRGLWFEEFETGVLYQHRPGRTITEADNVLFTTLTMNTQALQLDAAFSDALPPFNQRLVNSMFTLSTLVGLSVAQLTQGTSWATSASARSRSPSRSFMATPCTPRHRSPTSVSPRAAPARAS